MNSRAACLSVLVLVVAALGFATYACSDGNSADEGQVAAHSTPFLEVPRAKDPKPSEYVHMRPGDAEFDSFLSEFTDFPLYWLGDEFQGYPLESIVRHVFSPDLGKHEDAVSLLYGSCELPEGEGGCAPPVQVIIAPYCMVPPELVGNGTRPVGVEPVRGGAEAVMVGGGLRIWTGPATVKIYGASQALVDGAVAALVSPNGLGPTRFTDDLPPPDRDCSDYEMVPLR